MGIVIQMSVLAALVSGARLDYVPATALAVEAAVLHNFFWHERWTWADRTRKRRAGVLRRLLGFHVTNGALSLTGNILLMHFFVEKLDLHYLPANVLAITVCSILTFMAGDRIVFRAVAIDPKNGGKDMNSGYRLRLLPCTLFLAALLTGTTAAEAAELRPKTLEAWRACVEATEQRLARELFSSKGFLAMDFQDKSKALRSRRTVLSGEILIEEIVTLDKNGRPIHIPDGEVHHWRGAAFIPGVTLETVLEPLENPSPENAKQEDVLDYRVLEKAPGRHKLYLQLQRSRIVTVQHRASGPVPSSRTEPGVEQQRGHENRRARKCARQPRAGEAAGSRPRLPLAHEFLLALRTGRRRRLGGMRILDAEPLSAVDFAVDGSSLDKRCGARVDGADAPVPAHAYGGARFRARFCPGIGAIADAMFDATVYRKRNRAVSRPNSQAYSTAGPLGPGQGETTVQGSLFQM
jgi:putative flippase GtrA